ncbi:hypothetical protein CDL12_04042 [Handroanthus impetiginosus]|uniref:SBP-type domain-containing protein n=1 Tax=Handroanthus impetiginosus TaxID=429701 RepID=A0A2G9I0L1_9LAMI|nr:hypothetical protein CDL12_04042 [Handroanthus impetiginosus]
MDTKFSGKAHHLYGPVVSDLNGVTQKSVEWDLNDWRWDGDMFMAAPVNSAPSDCRSRQFFPVGSDIPLNNRTPNSFSSESAEAVLGDERETRDLEKRRRYIERNELVNEEAGSLNLKLGGEVFPVTESNIDKWEEKSGKKSKLSGAPSSRAVCQVEDCKADLSNAKDYHRRHKVCEAHSKATRALVGNLMQRFCQQCSRFHVLQEFDEGKRSCRRRLAGHNKRRRKTHPENVVSAATLNNEQGSSNLLISLIRILSNIASSSSDQTRDQDLLSHLLRNLANLAGPINERNPAGSLPVSPDLQNVGTSLGNGVKDLPGPTEPGVTVPLSNLARKSTVTDNAQVGAAHDASVSRQSHLLFPEKARDSLRKNASDTTVGKAKLNNIDLNNVYDSSQDCMENMQDSVAPENLGNVSTTVPLWLCKDSQRSSPPQNSGNSGSTRSHSTSTSSGEAQSRTDRIVFKLFGKDPSDFPLDLRKQILDWLSSSPTDIESYIRPGCIVLTIYASMDKSTWEELYCNLNSSMRRLLDSSTDSFWRTGWIYARVPHRATFVYNAQVVLDTPLPLNHQSCRISSITPIAVSFSEGVHFVVKGFNLSHPTSRLLCALEGNYLIQENCADMIGRAADTFVEHEEVQCLSFSCAMPNIVGRGFIEVEDNGLSCSFFPFIVAEKDVCSEICDLESIIEVTESADGETNKAQARNQALDFVHEMGWLLHKSRLILRLGETSVDMDLFPFTRFRWLIEFAIDHDWCAVVKKLLSIFFYGTVDPGQHASMLVALLDIGLLHRAVRKNSRSMVEFLLEYHASEAVDKTGPKEKQPAMGPYLFRPDTIGAGGLTPLHIAASLDNCENVLDALTEDPGSVGIEAWKNVRDSMGLTPYDYACLRGHYSYIHLVGQKLKKKSGNGQVVVDMKQKIAKMGALQTDQRTHCRQCEQKLAYGSMRASSSIKIYRPAMLSMVAIAAVCVCAALLFKSSPEVLYSFRPFRWELLKYGSE